MWEWIIVGLAVAAILIVKLLDYLDILDVAALLGGIVRLIASVVALLAALLLWIARTMFRTSATKTPAPPPRGRSRIMARHRGDRRVS